MGGASSSNKQDIDLQSSEYLYNVVNEVASQYIFKPTFIDLRKATDSKYCEQLTILTKDIIEKSLKERDIKDIHAKIYSKKTKDSVYVINNKALEKVNKDNSNKQKLCTQIARFYIKIYHIFLSIIDVISPKYKLKNKPNERSLSYDSYYKQLQEDPNLKFNVKNKDSGFCETKLLELLGQDKIVLNNIEQQKIFNINLESICYKHNESTNYYSSTTPELSNINKIKGFKNFKNLYYDIYNPALGKFTDMSSEMKKKYKADVIEFYKAFTNKTDEDAVLNNINDFDDIYFDDINTSFCEDYNSKKKKKINTATNDFKLFAKHLKKMYSDTLKYKKDLADILIKLVVKKQETNSTGYIYLINPNIKYADLEKFTDESRQIISKLYITCQQNFNKGLKLYNAILKSQVIFTSDEAITNLPDSINKIIKTNTNPEEVTPSSIKLNTTSDSATKSTVNSDSATKSTVNSDSATKSTSN